MSHNRLKIFFLLAPLLGATVCFGSDGGEKEVPFDNNRLAIDTSINELTKLAYTCKGVVVGVIDSFESKNYQGLSHGEWSVAYLKKVAPGARILTKQMILFKEGVVPNVIKKMTLKAVNTQPVLMIKKSSIQGINDIESLISEPDAVSCYPDKFEKVDIASGTKINLSLVLSLEHLDFYELSVNEKEYYAPLMAFTDGSFNLILDRTDFLEHIDKNGIDGPIATLIDDLRDQGALIITTSTGYIPSKDFDAALQRLGQAGDVFFQAAGNNSVPLAATEITLKQENLMRLNREIIARTAWRKRVESNLERGTCVSVGALQTKSKLADYSNKAALVKKAFISAIVSQEGPEGTSLAAPQLAGIVALLKEAYPDCPPKLLSKALLKTGTKLQHDPLEIEGGKGAVNPVGAFEKARVLCNAEPVGVKGQTSIARPPLPSRPGLKQSTTAGANKQQPIATNTIKIESDQKTPRGMAVGIFMVTSLALKEGYTFYLDGQRVGHLPQGLYSENQKINFASYPLKNEFVKTPLRLTLKSESGKILQCGQIITEYKSGDKVISLRYYLSAKGQTFRCAPMVAMRRKNQE